MLYLCEKPSQARDIAKVLGITQRHDGYLSGNGNAVTWCFGHLLEMAEPHAYDAQYKRWSLDYLPIIPKQWKLTTKKQARKQFTIIKKLLKMTRHVVIATDADREGEVIAREVMEAGNFQGQISRLWLSALDLCQERHQIGRWQCMDKARGNKLQPRHPASKMERLSQ